MVRTARPHPPCWWRRKRCACWVSDGVGFSFLAGVEYPPFVAHTSALNQGYFLAASTTFILCGYFVARFFSRPCFFFSSPFGLDREEVGKSFEHEHEHKDEYMSNLRVYGLRLPCLLGVNTLCDG
jgi:hypothetical protein